MSISATHIGKTIGHPSTRILTDISIEIKDGEFISLTGRSGSGKSTLLYILSSLDKPTEGKIEISNQDINKMESEQLYKFRNREMGFIFQFHYLLSELTALENVLMPAMKNNEQEIKKSLAHDLLEQFGLKDKIHRRPRELSGGEQQRVAIARALIMQPKYLFADEPTGSLDSVNGDLVMKIICDTNKKNKTTIVLVTHDPDFANLAQRQIKLVDGKIAAEE
jgi:ABC-type lipoprotein export system ATPase subunit